MKRSTPLTRNTETMLGHIETGYRSTSIFEIDKLAEALKVDYNALFAQD